MKLKKIFWLLCLCPFLLLSCAKESTSTPGAGTPANGSLASYNAIPIPTVDIANQVIPNLSLFFVTNKGPYVQVQNTAAQRWSVYKYQGGSGSNAWTSFVPNFAAMNYRPTSMFNEADNVFSIEWEGTDGTDCRYGMYNVNTGTPSFNEVVPGGSRGPYCVNEIIPPTKASNTGRAWFFVGFDEVWRESYIAVPRTFDHVLTLPTSDRISTDGIMADPDEDAHIWIGSGSKLYKVSEVGNPTAPYGSIQGSWDFSSAGSDRVQTIIKANGKVVIQFGDKIYLQNGTSFTRIGTLENAVVSNICTNGSTIFTSDGTYYDENSSSWKPFIGTGLNLSAANQARYAELKAYCSSGLPIGCVRGSGPIYLLALDKLIQVTPTY